MLRIPFLIRLIGRPIRIAEGSNAQPIQFRLCVSDLLIEYLPLVSGRFDQRVPIGFGQVVLGPAGEQSADPIGFAPRQSRFGSQLCFEHLGLVAQFLESLDLLLQ